MEANTTHDTSKRTFVQATTDRKLGNDETKIENACVLVRFLLTLANEYAKKNDNLWSMIEKNQPPHLRGSLREALVVKWSKVRSWHLLITNTRHDPEAEFKTKLQSNKPRRMETFLKALNTSLKEAHEQEIRTGVTDYQYRLTLTNINGNEKYMRDQLQELINCLEQLDLIYTYEEQKWKPQGYRTFYINFQDVGSYDTIKCVNHIETRWSAQKGNTNTTKKPKKPEKDPLAGLDDWVEANKNKVSNLFKRQREVVTRRIYIPLKTRIIPSTTVEGLALERIPTADDFKDNVTADNSQMILIWEEGGAGKTSLAFRIARWGLNKKLCEHTVLPFLLDPMQWEQGDLMGQILKDLKHEGIYNLEITLLQQLIEQKRLLLIIDHYTEYTDEVRDLVQKLLPAKSLVLLTARLNKRADFERQFVIKEVQPLRLERAQLLDFCDAYLKESATTGADSLQDESTTEDDKRLIKGLLERMVGNKPVTVLLAQLVIDSAIHYLKNQSDDILPTSVPDLINDYIKRIGDIIPEQRRVLPNRSQTEIKHDWIEPSLKALALKSLRQNETYFPQNFEFELAKQAMQPVIYDLIGWNDGEDEHLRNWLQYMEQELTLLQRKGGSNLEPIYRIALDPLADYFAAMALLMECEAKGESREQLDWIETWINKLKNSSQCGTSLEDMRGFLAACRECFLDKNMLGPSCNNPSLQERWMMVPIEIAHLAGIDIKLERWFEVKYLISRHAEDVKWNQEMRSKAIVELSCYGQEFAAVCDPSPAFQEAVATLLQAVKPLKSAMIKSALPEADRAAAAEALGHIGGPDAAEALLKQLAATQEPVAVRRAAAEALGLVVGTPKEQEAYWKRLRDILSTEANHLHGETFEAMDQKLPLLQGAARGLQRIASRSNQFPLPVWGMRPGLKVPMLTLSTSAGRVSTRMLVDVEVWQVPLPGGVPLEVVKIPGGHYTIGSPPEEHGRNDYDYCPEAVNSDVERLREVTVPSFAMSRFPITQAQWQTLTDCKYQREDSLELKPNPSQHKGADLPVHNVSWHHTREWLKRLNHWLAQQGTSLGMGDEPPELSLPGEGLWEVACRAGNDKPFHFGDTLDSSWANYDASHNYVYGGGRLGPNQQRPSIVGSYGLVNDYGLADMHGNVWEWCADVWQPDPSHSVLQHDRIGNEPGLGLEKMRELRGGSWFFDAASSRSSSRTRSRYTSHKTRVGFRVCCLPPGLLGL
jgi:formylglycine-generating enzyme required for sulfatase activity